MNHIMTSVLLVFPNQKPESVNQAAVESSSPWSEEAVKRSLLLEEVSVQRSVRGRLHSHLQHLHAFLEPGVSGAKPCGFQGLQRRENVTVKMACWRPYGPQAAQ